MGNWAVDDLYARVAAAGGLTHDILLKEFEYQDGLLLRKKRKGPEAVGSLNKTIGYLQFGFLGKTYYVHRFIWMLVTGDMKPRTIDHIDHNKLNNLITNLREASSIDNCRNASLSSANVSGTTGVHFEVSRQQWVAYIKVDRIRHHLGRFVSEAEAIEAREAANLLYGFHENHGKSGNISTLTTSLTKEIV